MSILTSIHSFDYFNHSSLPILRTAMSRSLYARLSKYIITGTDRRSVVTRIFYAEDTSDVSQQPPFSTHTHWQIQTTSQHHNRTDSHS
jgi:hypothetical protein